MVVSPRGWFAGWRVDVREMLVAWSVRPLFVKEGGCGGEGFDVGDLCAAHKTKPQSRHPGAIGIRFTARL